MSNQNPEEWVDEKGVPKNFRGRTAGDIWEGAKGQILMHYPENAPVENLVEHINCRLWEGYDVIPPEGSTGLIVHHSYNQIDVRNLDPKTLHNAVIEMMVQNPDRYPSLTSEYGSVFAPQPPVSQAIFDIVQNAQKIFKIVELVKGDDDVHERVLAHARTSESMMEFIAQTSSLLKTAGVDMHTVQVLFEGAVRSLALRHVMQHQLGIGQVEVLPKYLKWADEQMKVDPDAAGTDAQGLHQGLIQLFTNYQTPPTGVVGFFDSRRNHSSEAKVLVDKLKGIQQDIPGGTDGMDLAALKEARSAIEETLSEMSNELDPTGKIEGHTNLNGRFVQSCMHALDRVNEQIKDLEYDLAQEAQAGTGLAPGS